MNQNQWVAVAKYQSVPTSSLTKEAMHSVKQRYIIRLVHPNGATNFVHFRECFLCNNVVPLLCSLLYMSRIPPLLIGCPHPDKLYIKSHGS